METAQSCRPCRSATSSLLGAGAVRVAPLLGLSGLLVAHSVDPDAHIRSAGVDPALLNDPENTITFAAVGRLLQQAAIATGCGHIGLELCGGKGLDVLGLLGHAVRFAPDIRTALNALILHLHLHDRGAVPALWESGTSALFGYTLHCPDVTGTEHIYDCALAVMQNILRDLLGPTWRASEIRMFRKAPENAAPYRDLFQVPVRFGALQAAVVFPATHLGYRCAEADLMRYAAALRELTSLDADGAHRLADQVQRILRRLVVNGETDAVHLTRVARLFSLHPRTLNRRLRAEGTTFSALLGQTRYEIARQLLRDTELPTAEIGRALGYSEPAAFGHAFRRWSGTTAKAWRTHHRRT